MLCDSIILRDGSSFRDRIICLQRPVDAEFYCIDVTQRTLIVLDPHNISVEKFSIIGRCITEVLARDLRTNTNYKLRELGTPIYNQYYAAHSSLNPPDVRNRIALGYMLSYLKPQQSFCITQEFIEDLDSHGLVNIVTQYDFNRRLYHVLNTNSSCQFSSIRPLELPPRPSVNAFLSAWLVNRGGEIKINRKIFAKDPSLAQKRVVVVEDGDDENYVKLVLKDK